MKVGDRVKYRDDEGLCEVIEVHPNGMVVVLGDGFELWTHPENLTVIEEGGSYHE